MLLGRAWTGSMLIVTELITKLTADTEAYRAEAQRLESSTAVATRLPYPCSKPVL
jgi:hypothetical protein